MQERIDNLIAKKLSGNASTEESAELQSWINQEKANADHYAEAKRIWQLSGALRSNEQHLATDTAWNEFRALAGTGIRKKRRMQRTILLRMAAAFFFLVVTSMLVVYLLPGNEPQIADTGQLRQHADTLVKVFPVETTATMPAQENDSVAIISQEKVRSVGKRRRMVMIAVSSEDSGMVFRLPDNTLVYLNKFSKLTYPEKFTDAAHLVHLSGEAYFEPALGSDLFVQCHDTRTRAFGSAFNVKGMRDGVVEISAIDGEIEISAEKEGYFSPVRIRSGEQLIYDTQTRALTKTKVARKDRWWKKGGFRTFIRNFFNRIIHPRDTR